MFVYLKWETSELVLMLMRRNQLKVKRGHRLGMESRKQVKRLALEKGHLACDSNMEADQVDVRYKKYGDWWL